MFSLLFFFILFGRVLVSGLGVLLSGTAEHIVKERRKRRCAVRKIVVVAAAALLLKLVHLLGEIVGAEGLHQLREVAALHQRVHLILNGFQILVRNAHLADQVFNGLYFQLLGAAQTIADGGSILCCVV